MSLDAIGRLYRRLLMVFGRALINAVNDGGGLQLMQIQLGKDEIRDGTPRFAEYGFTSNPKPGARAIAVFMGGDRSNGAVVATDDPRYRPTGLKSGEVVIYDDLGQKVYLTRTGIVIDAPLGLAILGNLVVTGAITASEEVKAFNVHTVSAHTHPDPQGGSTGTPTG